MKQFGNARVETGLGHSVSGQDRLPGGGGGLAHPAW